MSNSIGIFNTLIDKISGVKELQYYLNVTNLNIKILLLGETHKTGKCDECFYPSCMSVDIFIYYLALKKTECIDFFIERMYNKPKPFTYYGGAKEKSNSDGIHSISNQTIESSNEFWEKRKSNLGRDIPIRIHNWDARIYHTKKLLNDPDNMYSILPEYHINIWWKLFNKDKHGSFILSRLSEDKKKKMKDAFKYLKTNVSNTVSLKDIILYIADYTWGDNLDKVINIVETYYILCGGKPINNKIDIIPVSYSINKQLNKLNKSLDFNKHLIKNAYKNAWYHECVTPDSEFIDPMDISLFSSDLYLLGRMFRTYNMERHINNTPKGCETTNYPKNIIVYGGAKHIRIINNTLKILLGERPLYSISSKENNCVSGIMD